MSAERARPGADAGEEGLLARRPELALVAVTAVWGSTFIVTKGLLRALPPLPYLCMRFGLGALSLWLLYPRTLRARAALRDGTLLGLGQGLGLLLQVWGQLYTTASKSAFVTALSTVLTPAFAYVVYRQKALPSQAIAAILATVGLGLLTWPGAGAAWNRGDLLSVGCALAYAWVIVETARRSPRHDFGALATIQTTSAFGMFLLAMVLARAAAVTLPAESVPHLLVSELRPLQLDAAIALRIAYMAVVCTAFTFAAQTWAMRRMSATHAAVIFALEPVFATGMAIAVEGQEEWPGPRGAIGALVIVLSVLVSELRRDRS